LLFGQELGQGKDRRIVANPGAEVMEGKLLFELELFDLLFHSFQLSRGCTAE